MRTPRIIGITGAAIMTIALVLSVANGDVSDEGSRLVNMAWGRMTLVDLYVGAALVGAWIAHRERSWPRTIVWWLALIVFGHLASAAYVLAASRSPDWPSFWSGPKA